MSADGRRKMPGAVALPSPRVAMVCATRASVDGILDYAQGLGEALARLHNLRVELVLRRPGRWSIRRLGSSDGPERYASTLTEALEGVHALILHYNPFSWGHWGFSPGLAVSLARLRRRRPAITVGILAHERYVDMCNLRSALMGGWQRAQFLALVRMADVTYASTEAWTVELHRHNYGRVAQIPICSNLPDRRLTRDASRERLALDKSTLAVAVFGTDHPSRLVGHIELALAAVAAGGRPVTLLNLGAGAPAIRVPDDASIRVVAPGELDAASVAEHLAAADLYLAAFVDGVSGRRTTLMAALQHALPIVGTHAHHTDGFIRDADDALLLTPSDDVAAFACAARRLADDPGLRARRGVAARRFYEARCDWPVACRVALTGLTGQA